MYRTAHNLCVNHLKRKKRMEFQNIDSKNLPAQDCDSFIRNVEEDELNARIQEIIESMDPLSKSIFILRRELDMPVSEIAGHIGKSERTVRRKLQNMLINIQKSLINSGFITFILPFMSAIPLLFVIRDRGVT
jgi:RNA polymerase sigma factor (sigma-70 family)